MSIKNKDGKREHPKTYGPTRTDQAAGPATRIGNMIRRFKDTGENWPAAQQVLNFGDVSELPDLHEMMTRSTEALSAFRDLPVQIRHKCKHDAANLEEFLLNPENREMCEHYGLIEPPVDLTDAETKSIEEIRAENTPPETSPETKPVPT